MAQKILLVNKFYYPRGGDCVVMMNTESMLLSAGYDVAVFAMQYPGTADSPYKRYFANEVNFSGGISEKLNGLKRTLGLGDIRTSFKRILDDFKPDVVHLHNIHSYLSPKTEQRDIVLINRFVDDKEVRDLFSKAAVVVYPYISATQSGVISIASYFKKPIVLSDVPYFKEVASGYDGVYFFPQRRHQRHGTSHQQSHLQS